MTLQRHEKCNLLTSISSLQLEQSFDNPVLIFEEEFDMEILQLSLLRDTEPRIIEEASSHNPTEKEKVSAFIFGSFFWD
ncbi:unnamed protein product [Dovyalis caffra]|uniref:Uncharacterized protein n=1 Tax=Dovyalis caffra TaxID=77055 RepID=A0AAV1SU82_9ROSI|nr:unnamed protein product [Dovyalis caffra]